MMQIKKPGAPITTVTTSAPKTFATNTQTIGSSNNMLNAQSLSQQIFQNQNALNKIAPVISRNNSTGQVQRLQLGPNQTLAPQSEGGFSISHALETVDQIYQLSKYFMGGNTAEKVPEIASQITGGSNAESTETAAEAILEDGAELAAV